MTRALLLVIRIALGALFAWAGVVKLGDANGFAVEITNYRLLPALAPYLAVMLPGVELATGVALMIGPRRFVRAAALVATLLLLAFTVAVTQVVVRGINIQCGCFGGDAGPVTWLTVLRDALLLGAALTVLVLDGRSARAPLDPVDPVAPVAPVDRP